jgi:hypothetical protein
VDDSTHNYRIGDLVLCRYEFDYLYYPTYLNNSSETFYIGIVIDYKENQVVFFDREIVYQVLCTDGHRRYFAKWEMVTIRKA